MNKSMRRNVLTFVGMAAVVMGLVTGCGEKADPSLATPTSTIQKYVSIASTLNTAKEINLGMVRDGLQCFTKGDRDWFEKNYKDFPLDDISGNIVMAVTEPVIKAAMVFNYGVVRHGPHGEFPKIELVSQSETDATVKVDDYFTIPLVKEGPNWRIKGLFGAPSQ